MFGWRRIDDDTRRLNQTFHAIDAALNRPKLVLSTHWRTSKHRSESSSVDIDRGYILSALGLPHLREGHLALYASGQAG
jgi:hypothetical protein